MDNFDKEINFNDFCEREDIHLKISGESFKFSTVFNFIFREFINFLYDEKFYGNNSRIKVICDISKFLNIFNFSINFDSDFDHYKLKNIFNYRYLYSAFPYKITRNYSFRFKHGKDNNYFILNVKPKDTSKFKINFDVFNGLFAINVNVDIKSKKDLKFLDEGDDIKIMCELKCIDNTGSKVNVKRALNIKERKLFKHNPKLKDYNIINYEDVIDKIFENINKSFNGE